MPPAPRADIPPTPATPAPRLAPGRRGVLGASLLIVLALAAAYSNSFQGEFIFDDITSIPKNEEIRRLWPPAPFVPRNSTGRTVDGRPLVSYSLAVNYAISGSEVWSYHVFNWIVHALAALTLFGLVRRTLCLPTLRTRYGDRATGLALAAALIWGLHPLQTESVTYVIQRSESLMGLFFLLVLYCLARAAHAPRPGRWLGLTVVCCLVGMGAKEVMAVAPLVALLYERTFVFSSWRELLSRLRRLYLGLAASWLVLLAMTGSFGARGNTAGFGHGVTSWQYAATQFGAITNYLRLTISPYPLALDYGTRLATDHWDIWPYAAFIGALVAGTLVALVKWPAVGFLGASFFLVLAPSSSIVPVITQTAAEHRMYVPLAAVVVLLLLAADAGWQRLRQRWPPHKRDRRLLRAAPAVIVGAVVTLLGLLTWLRNLDYRTPLTIWTATAAAAPYNPRAFANLGELYAEQGNDAEAMAAATRAVELDPSGEQNFNRGTFLLYLHRFEEAILDFDETLRMKPTHAQSHQNRGVAHRHLHHHEQAIDDFTAAIRLDANLLLAYRNRALAYASLAEIEKAKADARRYLDRSGVQQDEEMAKILATPASVTDEARSGASTAKCTDSPRD